MDPLLTRLLFWQLCNQTSQALALLSTQQHFFPPFLFLLLHSSILFFNPDRPVHNVVHKVFPPMFSISTWVPVSFRSEHSVQIEHNVLNRQTTSLSEAPHESGQEWRGRGKGWKALHEVIVLYIMSIFSTRNIKSLTNRQFSEFRIRTSYEIWLVNADDGFLCCCFFLNRIKAWENVFNYYLDHYITQNTGLLILHED